MDLRAPNFANINLLPEFQNTPLEFKSARLYRFDLPLKSPLVFKHTTLSRREGLILVLTDHKGHAGISEISPLPGYSRETLETTILHLTMLLEKLIRSGEFDAHCTDNEMHGWEDIADPSLASFGIEFGILSLLADKWRVNTGDLLFGRSSERVPLNGLIRSSIADWVPEAERMVSEGFTTIKIKVGRINSVLEARGIQDIRSSVGSHIKIRLDANQSWELREAIDFGRAVEATNIEYIEEPLKNATELPMFHDACGVPFAFDETLHHIMDPTISFDSYTGLRALVLKPTLIACTARLTALIKQAKNGGVLAVLSSSYESDLGLNSLAQLAGAISGEDVAIGLDTRSALAAGTVHPSEKAEKAWMSTKPIRTQDLDLRDCELLYES